jgi:hypothetical protein
MSVSAAIRVGEFDSPCKLADSAKRTGFTHPTRVDGLARLREEADVVVCPRPLEQIAVVGQAYDIFDPLDEWYVVGLLADAAAGAAG